MDYSFREVMDALKRFIKTEGVSGSIFAESSFWQMMNQTEEFESKIMAWAKEHPEPKKKTWGEVLSELGLVNKEYIIPLASVEYGVDDAFHTAKEIELRKEVPDEILTAIEQYLKNDKDGKWQ